MCKKSNIYQFEVKSAVASYFGVFLLNLFGPTFWSNFVFSWGAVTDEKLPCDDFYNFCFSVRLDLLFFVDWSPRCHRHFLSEKTLTFSITFFFECFRALLWNNVSNLVSPCRKRSCSRSSSAFYEHAGVSRFLPHPKIQHSWPTIWPTQVLKQLQK